MVAFGGLETGLAFCRSLLPSLPNALGGHKARPDTEPPHILEIRDQARQALGDRFSLKDFHDVVLSSGHVPLDVLQELVDAWVAAGLAA